MKINKFKASEIWINDKRVGIIVEEWFYPAPGVQLGAKELRNIADEIQCASLKLKFEGHPQEESWLFDEIREGGPNWQRTPDDEARAAVAWLYKFVEHKSKDDLIEATKKTAISYDANKDRFMLFVASCISSEYNQKLYFRVVS